MLTLGEIFTIFLDTLAGHAGLAVYLFAIMDERRWRQLKKLPALLLSPLAVGHSGDLRGRVLVLSR